VALLGLFLVALGAHTDASAEGSVSVSPDITVELDSLTFADEDVAVDNLMGSSVPTSLGTLPENTAVTAYELLSNGEQLFPVDTTVQLAGPLVVQRRDVIRYDGAGYALEFDGSAEGIPEGRPSMP
jgi:hypothetical protein